MGFFSGHCVIIGQVAKYDHNNEYTFTFVLGKKEISSELKRSFGTAQGDQAGPSKVSTDESLMAKAQRMIGELKSDPLMLTERHKKRRKQTRLSNTWSREFQKNLVVIDYQGSNPSPVLHDYDKVYEGPVTFFSGMSEEDVREAIASLVKRKKSITHTFIGLGGKDFEFVKCANRHVRVLDGEVTYDGNGIKNMYRSGSVYVRLTHYFSTVKINTKQYYHA